MVDFDMDPIMDPAEFFIWDDLVDPGKQYPCPELRTADGWQLRCAERKARLPRLPVPGLWCFEQH